jgi:hypothetical protein
MWVLLLLLVAGCASGGAFERSQDPSEDAQGRSQEASIGPSSAPSQAASTFEVGDVITITEDGDPWADFTVMEVRQDTEFIDPSGFYNDTPQIEGYVFLSALVRYEAIVDGVHYNPLDFQIFVSDVAADNIAFALNAPEPQLHSGELPAGRVAEGWLLYEVPPTGEVLLSYNGNIFINDAPVFEVVLRAQ